MRHERCGGACSVICASHGRARASESESERGDTDASVEAPAPALGGGGAGAAALAASRRARAAGEVVGAPRSSVSWRRPRTPRAARPRRRPRRCRRRAADGRCSAVVPVPASVSPVEASRVDRLDERAPSTVGCRSPLPSRRRCFRTSSIVIGPQVCSQLLCLRPGRDLTQHVFRRRA